MYIITARRVDEYYYLSKKEFVSLPKDPREALKDAYSFSSYKEAELYCKNKKFEIKGQLVELTNRTIGFKFNLEIRSIRMLKPSNILFEEDDVRMVTENVIDSSYYSLVVSFDGVVSLLKRDGTEDINNFACSNGELLSSGILKNSNERQKLIHSEYMRLLGAWHGHITTFGEFWSGSASYIDIDKTKKEIINFLNDNY